MSLSHNTEVKLSPKKPNPEVKETSSITNSLSFFQFANVKVKYKQKKILTSKKKTVLLRAICSGNIPVVKQTLQTYDININELHRNHYLLILAAQGGHFSLVKLFLENGANSNISDAHGIKPLMYAARNNDVVSLTALLQEKTTQINAQDDEGRTALWHAFEGAYSNRYVSHNNYALLIAILIAAGADINVKNKQGISLTAFLERYEDEWNTAYSWALRLNMSTLLSEQVDCVSELRSDQTIFNSIKVTVESQIFMSKHDLYSAQMQALLEDYFSFSYDPLLQIMKLRMNKAFFKEVTKDVRLDACMLHYQNDSCESLTDETEKQELENFFIESNEEKLQNQKEIFFLRHYFAHNKQQHTLNQIISNPLVYYNKARTESEIKEINAHIEDKYLLKLADAISQLSILSTIIENGKIFNKNYSLKEDSQEIIKIISYDPHALFCIERDDWISYCPGLLRRLLFARLSLGSSLLDNEQELDDRASVVKLAKP